MLLLGLLLMAASGAFVGLLIADNLSGGPEYQVTILGTDLVRLNTLAVFLAGVALALIFCLGLALMWSSRRRTARPVGAARSARHRAGYREAEPVEPVRRSAPAERAAPGYERPVDDTPAQDGRATDPPDSTAPVSTASVTDAPGGGVRGGGVRGGGVRGSDVRGSGARGSAEEVAPPEERAAELGGREEPARSGGWMRHLFGP
ncbi:hypothetical protein ACIRST_01915 [Kitasatospora sp. NPDC101447]|uniref:hypothetical protein n=1 Tax=Kitasatospora sp. NPDC101447 TaxID=3364102 RepID=UPI00380E94A8